MATIEQRTDRMGRVTHRAKVRLKGARSATATFHRLTDAKKWVAATESAMREGRHFKTAEAKRHTLGDAIERYLATVMPRKPRSERVQRQQLAWWRARLGYVVLADLTPSLIGERRDALGAENTARGCRRSPASVNRYLAALSHVLSVAASEWGWLDSSPVRMVTKLKEARGRVRFLDDGERERLLTACRGDCNLALYPVVVVALSTGMRLGEIMGLTWTRVDFARGCVTLDQTKNGDRRTVPLTGHALETLRGRARTPRLGSPLVFPGRDCAKPVDIRLPWERAVAAAKLVDFRFHDLRHSAASYLAMNGATATEIAAVLGHKTLAMVKRYAHLSEAHTSGVVERMNTKIFGDGP